MAEIVLGNLYLIYLHKIATIHWIIEKVREFQKNIYVCFINYASTFDCVDHNKLWKILKEIGIPDHLICLLRNLHAGQEQQLKWDMEEQTGLKIKKGVYHDYIFTLFI